MISFESPPTPASQEIGATRIEDAFSRSLAHTRSILPWLLSPTGVHPSTLGAVTDLGSSFRLSTARLHSETLDRSMNASFLSQGKKTQSESSTLGGKRLVRTRFQNL